MDRFKHNWFCSWVPWTTLFSPHPWLCAESEGPATLRGLSGPHLHAHTTCPRYGLEGAHRCVSTFQSKDLGKQTESLQGGNVRVPGIQNTAWKGRHGLFSPWACQIPALVGRGGQRKTPVGLLKLRLMAGAPHCLCLRA